jgi:hypothetical protein
MGDFNTEMDEEVNMGYYIPLISLNSEDNDD